MALVIPIQAVPSQQVLCVLDGQNCQIAVYQKDANVYVDLNSDGVDMFICSLGLNGVPLDPLNSYDGFSGNLYFIDAQGTDDPDYTGFGTRWFLVYLTAAEVALTAFVPSFAGSITAGLMTLSAMLNVTAVEPGNFSVAHGLATVPVLIAILPTAAGAIWAQANFADLTNINLVASDVGITATVLVFTSVAAGLTVQTPAATLLATSAAPGDFKIAHGLTGAPAFVALLPTSAGAIWFQDPAFDATYVYLVASDVSESASVIVYAPVTGAINLNQPATTLVPISGAPGNFALPHGLAAAPSRIEILMISAGVIWAQSPAFDGTNVYLTASDVGVAAKILVYA